MNVLVEIDVVRPDQKFGLKFGEYVHSDDAGFTRRAADQTTNGARGLPQKTILQAAVALGRAPGARGARVHLLGPLFSRLGKFLRRGQIDVKLRQPHGAHAARRRGDARR